MSGFMLHGLGDCTPERHCGCLDIPAMTAPEPTRPTDEHTDAVAPNLDALHETICDKFTGMAEVRQSADLLVAEVRRLVKFRDWWKASSLANAEDVRRLTAICHDWRDRSEAAEAEVVTLRARLARSRSRYCGCGWCCSNNADGVVPGDAHLICSRYRAALATTGEVQ